MDGNFVKDKVLILGARGMLGTDLAKQFANAGGLFLWDKEEMDVTREPEVKEKITHLAPQVIINAAGFTDVDGAEENRELAFRINGEAVKYLVEAASGVGAKLVHFSTEYVFLGEDNGGYAEDAVPQPLNVYGESKLAGEKYMVGYTKGYLVRTSWLYGHAPQVGKPRGLNFVDTIIKLANERPKIKVVNDQFGKLTNTQDLAAAVKELVSRNYAPGIYHLVNEGVATWYAVAKRIFEIKNITTKLAPISSQEFPTRAKRPCHAVLLNTKFPKLRPWVEALKDYLS